MISGSKIQVLGIVGFGLALLIALHYARILTPVEGSVSSVLAPAQRWAYDLALSWGLTRFDEQGQTLEDLKKENQSLRDQVNNFLVENLRIQERLEAFSAIEQQQTFLDQYSIRSTPAKIIGRGSDQASSTLLANQGAKQGIEVGMPVVIEKGILIGKISEVEPNTSKVELVTTSGSKTSAIVLSEKEVQGIVEGQHGLSLELTFVLQSEILRPNDVVITSGEEEKIPKNLILGTLQEVNRSPGELWQSSTILPPFRPSTIHFVSIILRPHTP